MPTILLGIDLGTTELKIAALDAGSGKLLASASRQLSVRTDGDGTREQMPSAINRNLKSMASELQHLLGKRWQQVAGIGLAAQGGSAILADRESGDAHTSMQLWNDTRPLARLDAIAARRPKGYWKRLARLPMPGAGLARIEWLRDQFPSLVPDTSSTERSLPTNTLYAGAGEYTFFQLTGKWRQDAGNALQIGCYSVSGQALTAKPLETVKVPLNFVSPLRAGHERHALSQGGANLLGLPEGIPVAGPYIDHEAGYLSAAGRKGQALQCSLGTAWVGNFVAGADIPPSPGLDLVLPSPLEKGNLVLRVMAAGNVTWNWALSTLASPRQSTALKMADAIFRDSLVPHDGLLAFPWFTRPNIEAAELSGNGGFLGLNPHTEKADMIRAVVCGLVFEFAQQFDSVTECGLVDHVVLGGGASKGWWFQKLMAAVFAPLPVYVARDSANAGARGCVYAFSAKAATASASRVTPPPQSLRSRIGQHYTLYRSARKRMEK